MSVQQFVFWLIINSHISPPPPSIPPKLMAVAKPVICGLENIKQNAKLKHALYQSFKKKKKKNCAFKCDTGGFVEATLWIQRQGGFMEENPKTLTFILCR